MGASRLFDTGAVIELVARRGVELVPGAISVLTVVEYPPATTRALRILYPSKQDCATAIRWQVALRKRGTPLPAVDLIIAATAFNNGLTLVTLDKHFRLLKEVEPRIEIEFSV